MPPITIAELFKLVDRKEDLGRQLEDKFPEHDYLSTLESFRRHLSYAARQLERAIEDVAAVFEDHNFQPPFAATGEPYSRAVAIGDFLEKYTPRIFQFV